MGRGRARGVVARSMPDRAGEAVSPEAVGEVGRWCLAPFDASTTAALLFAACSSPGAVHRLPTLAEWAQAADPVLLPLLGFGVADVVELALRLIAVQRRALVGSWTGRRPADAAEPATVTGGEVAAAAAFLDRWRAQTAQGGLPGCLREIGGTTGDLALTDAEVGRLVKAMDWCTRDAGELSARPGWLLQGGLL